MPVVRRKVFTLELEAVRLLESFGRAAAEIARDLHWPGCSSGVSTVTLFSAAVMLAGCSGFSWNPWSSSEVVVARTPPGAKGYACEGGKRLLVRYAADAKSAVIIHPQGEYRLDRAAAASGEQFSNGSGTTLAIREGEATLQEGGAVQFAKCKLEPDTK